MKLPGRNLVSWSTDPRLIGERDVEPCPYCRSACDVVRSLCGERLECLSCGALWFPGRYASHGVIGLRYELTRDPREEIPDPDDRPYLWDLDQED